MTGSKKYRIWATFGTGLPDIGQKGWMRFERVDEKNSHPPRLRHSCGAVYVDEVDEVGEVGEF